jgi:hypothetical protein
VAAAHLGLGCATVILQVSDAAADE